MQFVEHGVYLVRHLVQLQAQYFEAIEVLGYEEQYIIYGYLRPDEIRPTLGFQETPGRRIAFPFFPGATHRELAQMIAVCGGEPLSVSPAHAAVGGHIKLPEHGAEELLLVNCNKGLGYIWGNQTWKRIYPGPMDMDRDALVRKTTRQIDLYLDWKRLGAWPQWFRDDLFAAKAPVNRN